jgi:hypothetical protein
MGFFNRLTWLFFSPSKVFDDIAEGRVSWWQPWVWMSMIYLVVGYFSIPIQRAVMEMNTGDLPMEQLEQQLEWFDKFGYIQLLGTPLVFLVLGLIVAGLGYILVSILSEKANFKKFFTLYFYGGIIASLATVVSVLAVRMKGIESLRVPEDAQFSIGLAFMGPTEGVVLKSVFMSLEFFSMWSLVVVAMGLMHVFGMQRKHAIYCVIPLWLMGVLLLMLNNLATGMN